MRILLENYNAGTSPAMIANKKHSYYKTHHYYCRPLVMSFKRRPMVRWLKRNCFAIRCVMLTDHACLHEKSLIKKLAIIRAHGRISSEITYSQLKGAVTRLLFKLKRNENRNTTKTNVIVQKKKIANG